MDLFFFNLYRSKPRSKRWNIFSFPLQKPLIQSEEQTNIVSPNQLPATQTQPSKVTPPFSPILPDTSRSDNTTSSDGATNDHHHQHLNSQPSYYQPPNQNYGNEEPATTWLVQDNQTQWQQNDDDGRDRVDSIHNQQQNYGYDNVDHQVNQYVDQQNYVTDSPRFDGGEGTEIKQQDEGSSTQPPETFQPHYGGDQQENEPAAAQVPTFFNPAQNTTSSNFSKRRFYR